MFLHGKRLWNYFKIVKKTEMTNFSKDVEIREFDLGGSVQFSKGFGSGDPLSDTEAQIRST